MKVKKYSSSCIFQNHHLKILLHDHYFKQSIKGLSRVKSAFKLLVEWHIFLGEQSFWNQ